MRGLEVVDIYGLVSAQLFRDSKLVFKIVFIVIFDLKLRFVDIF